MQATITDLRYHMKEVLQALNRNEQVTVIYHKKPIATLALLQTKRQHSVQSHPFYGFLQHETSTVELEIDKLRSGRHDDI